jgi:hypothetical protein
MRLSQASITSRWKVNVRTRERYSQHDNSFIGMCVFWSVDA